MRLRNLYIIGAILTILGSFLPWEQGGDFISYHTAGVQLYWGYSYSYWLKDNGGLLIVLLSLVTIGMILYPSRFIKNPTVWTIVSGVILVVVSVYHIGSWLVRRIAAGEIIGAPTLEIGLVLVLTGSLILLGSAMFHHRVKSIETLINWPVFRLG
jgi:hypothetical protein